MAYRFPIAAVLVCLLLAACAPMRHGQPAQKDLVPVPAAESSSAGPENFYRTYVNGSPPLVSDRFLLNNADQRIVGRVQIIEARYEDTFVDIARAYNLGFDELLEANPDVDPWLPGAGTRIVLPTRFILPDAPQEGLVINLANKRVFWYVPADEDGQRAVMTFPIGIGREGNATPTGVTSITMKAKDPTWFVPAAIRAEYAAEGNPLPKQVPPGPDNPLGSYALILGMPSYLIHGTNRPAGVGMRVSHGCIRLFPENIAVLYSEVSVGTPVTIVDQPWLFAWEGSRLYLEAHPPLADDVRDWDGMLPGMLAKAMAGAPYAEGAEVNASQAQSVADKALGVPLPVLDGELSAGDYLERAKLVNNIVLLPPETGEQIAQKTR